MNDFINNMFGGANTGDLAGLALAGTPEGAVLQFANTESGAAATKGAFNLVTVLIILCVISCCISCCSSISNVTGLCVSGNSLVTKFTFWGLGLDCCCLCMSILFPPLLIPALIFICLRYALMFSGQCKKLNRSFTKS
uniref:Uncharacterized protein n=1 Tax=viral metagenome TaxID=1070528 RepID=A0A6C0ACJ1_9ZZZZ